MNKDKKEILIIVTKGEVGGAQAFVFNLAQGLKQDGFNITVGFGQGDNLKHKLNKSGISFVNFKYLRRTHNPFKNLFFIWELYKFCSQNKFDIVHFNSSNSLVGALGAKLSKNKPKIIFTAHGLSMLDKNYKARSLLKTIYYLFFKFFFLFVDRVVFVSKKNMESAKSIKLVKKSDVAFNGLDNNDLNFLDRREARNFLANLLGIKISNNDLLIGSIGRLAYPKNYEFLIKIFSDIKKVHPSIKLIIIGDGPNRKKYKKLIKKYNLEENIYLAGEISEASRYLKAFDLFVLPSIYEGLSITLIESLFAKVPMLVSDVGGNKEIVSNENCRYKLNNKKEFLEKMNYILKNKNKFACSNEFVSQFELERMIEAYKRIYFQN